MRISDWSSDVCSSDLLDCACRRRVTAIFATLVQPYPSTRTNMLRTINPSRMDFVTLKLFCAVAQSGSITKGADICHIALSAASRRISDFEAADEVQLFERSDRKSVG